MTWWTVAIGVDTHKQWHVAVALDRLGRLIDSMTVEATSGWVSAAAGVGAGAW